MCEEFQQDLMTGPFCARGFVLRLCLFADWRLTDIDIRAQRARSAMRSMGIRSDKVAVD